LRQADVAILRGQLPHAAQGIWQEVVCTTFILLGETTQAVIRLFGCKGSVYWHIILQYANLAQLRLHHEAFSNHLKDQGNLDLFLALLKPHPNLRDRT
jgi:hypothetical protein